jgi:hypothetical protein
MIVTIPLFLGRGDPVSVLRPMMAAAWHFVEPDRWLHLGAE